jgi:hypothetical protein
MLLRTTWLVCTESSGRYLCVHLISPLIPSHLSSLIESCFREMEIPSFDPWLGSFILSYLPHFCPQIHSLETYILSCSHVLSFYDYDMKSLVNSLINLTHETLWMHMTSCREVTWKRRTEKNPDDGGQSYLERQQESYDSHPIKSPSHELRHTTRLRFRRWKINRNWLFSSSNIETSSPPQGVSFSLDPIFIYDIYFCLCFIVL